MQIYYDNFVRVNSVILSYMHQYCKSCVKRPLSKRPQIGFHCHLSLNAGQKYCRMLQGEHSAIRSTFIKLLFVIKIFVLSIFEWLFYTGFTVQECLCLVNIEVEEKKEEKAGCFAIIVLQMYSTISVLWLFLMVPWVVLQFS